MKAKIERMCRAFAEPAGYVEWDKLNETTKDHIRNGMEAAVKAAKAKEKP